MKESQKRANENYAKRMKDAKYKRIKIWIAPEDKQKFYDLAAISQRKHKRNLRKLEA